MKQKAFTLIELLVVIAIIGLIASIVLVNLRGTREKAHVARGLSFSQSVYHALGAYVSGIYRFEKTEDVGFFRDTSDLSGYGNHLRCTSMDCSLTEGIIGNAFNNDTNGRMFFSFTQLKNFNFSETNEIIIEAWFKIINRDPNSSYVIVGIGVPAPDCMYQIAVQSMGETMYPSYGVTDCSIQIIFDFTFELNKWYHYVMTVKGGGEAEIYVNGKSIYKGTNGVPTTLPNGINISTGLGQISDHVIIDEVRIYNAAFNL